MNIVECDGRIDVQLRRPFIRCSAGELFPVALKTLEMKHLVSGSHASADSLSTVPAEISSTTVLSAAGIL